MRTLGWPAAAILLGLLALMQACDGESLDAPSTGTPRQVRTELAGVATELAAGGPFRTTDEAETMVGYRLLRPDPALLISNDERGLVDVYPEIGLPAVRQGFTLIGHDQELDVTQEPETYPVSPPHGRRSTVTFGRFSGTLTEESDGQIAFRFLTGEQIDGVPIRALVASLGPWYSRADVEQFVESMTFAE